MTPLHNNDRLICRCYGLRYAQSENLQVLEWVCLFPLFHAEYGVNFNDKLDELCVACEGKISPDTEEKIISLIDSIIEELILPKRESYNGY